MARLRKATDLQSVKLKGCMREQSPPSPPLISKQRSYSPQLCVIFCVRKTILCKCKGCASDFQKDKREFDRRVREGNDNFYCSRQCFGLHSPKLSKYIRITSNCIVCQKQFETTNKPKASKTCSVACATKLGFSNLSQETKDIRSSKIKQNWVNGVYNKRIKHGVFSKDKSKYLQKVKSTCHSCNLEFVSENRTGKPNKTCSKECRAEINSKRAKANPNCGGSTNYKRFRYKEILMDSSWEVDLAQWMDDNKIKWVRSRKICLFWRDEKGDLRRYYPDFYLPEQNVYLDPKNKFLQEKDKFKLEQVVKHQNVTIFSGYLDAIKSKIRELSHSNPTV